MQPTVRAYDLRPKVTPPRWQLAPRVEALDGKTILLFDNGKLDPAFGWSFAGLFDNLARALEEQFGATIVRFAEDLLSATPDRVTSLARWVEASEADGVVFALLDVGIAQPTAALAAHVEALGVPTVSVCQGPGIRIAATSAAPLIDALALSDLGLVRTASLEQVEKETVRLVREIAAHLAGSPDAIREGFRAAGGVLPTPCVEGGMLELDGLETTLEFTELMMRGGIGDGFPLVCPTEELVQSLVAGSGQEPADEVWPVIPPRSETLTVHDVAVIAAVAGCRPQWMPIVIAAFRAMTAPEFRLPLAAISGNPAGTLVLASGPEASGRGLASRDGCLGPGHPANAAIGRAVSLSYSVALGARIGSSDLSLQGSPAEYSFCCAENLAESPWQGLNVDLTGDPDATTVTVLKCDGPRTVLDNLSTSPEALLRTFAAGLTSIASNNAYVPRAQTVIFMNPEHAGIVHAGGWSKRDVQEFLFETARNDPGELEGRGYVPNRPDWMADLQAIPIAERPEDILVVVAGASGNLSQVSLPWGFSRGATATVVPR